MNNKNKRSLFCERLIMWKVKVSNDGTITSLKQFLLVQLGKIILGGLFLFLTLSLLLPISIPLTFALVLVVIGIYGILSMSVWGG